MGHDEEDNGEGRKKRRGNNVKLFDASGMTEEERRALRRKQRDLHHKVTNEVDRAENEDAMEFLHRKRGDNNELFEQVRYTREAVLDAENTDLIAAKTLQQVDRLVQVARFDATKLASKLRSKCSTGQGASKQFSWSVIGRECGVCFNAVPHGVSFLAGTMDHEETVVKKARKQRTKRGDAEVIEEQKPEQVVNNVGDADQLSAAEKAMKDVKKVLKKKCKLKEGEPIEIDGVQFLFNPKSFTQTVENIFHFSFLIKRGEAEIGVRAKDEVDSEEKLSGLWVKAGQHMDDEGNLPPSTDITTQSVVSFNMRDWRRICEAHNLEEGMIKHRTGSKHQRVATGSASQNGA